MWAPMNKIDVNRFAVLIPMTVRRPQTRRTRTPCKHPRNKSSSTIGCHTVAMRSATEKIRCHGNGWTTTSKGNIPKKTAPTARPERNAGER